MLSHVLLFATLWTTTCQAFPSFAVSWSLPKLMSIESMKPSDHIIFCHPLLLPLIFPSISVFSDLIGRCPIKNKLINLESQKQKKEKITQQQHKIEPLGWGTLMNWVLCGKVSLQRQSKAGYVCGSESTRKLPRWEYSKGRLTVTWGERSQRLPIVIIVSFLFTESALAIIHIISSEAHPQLCNFGGSHRLSKKEI